MTSKNNVSDHASPLSTTLMLVGAVVLSGAMVMLYEFIAVRVLARYLGGSTDIWASVISVLMAGLSLGYAVGGILADRIGGFAPMGWAMIFGGLLGGAIEPIANLAGPALVQLDFAYALHPYVASALVSFLPIFALGTVLPQAIRLRAEITNRVGAAAGWISGLSTLGSILGTILTVHVFLPHIGLRETLYGASSVLFLMGLALILFRNRKTAALLLAVAFLAAPARAQVLYDQYTAYHHILVEDRGGERQLRFDDAVQTTMSLRDPYAGGFEYTDFFHMARMLNPTMKTAVFLGLGGGTGPKAFYKYYPEVQVYAAEIDPQVVQVARQYFALPQDPRLEVVVVDGRVLLQRNNSVCGAIIVDAYASGPYGPFIPFHLVTQEFFRLAWSRLENGGVLVYNVVGKYGGEFHETIQGVYATLGSVFQALYAFEARSSINTVFVAQKIDAHAVPQENAPTWPNAPWLNGMMDRQTFSRNMQTLGKSGLITFPGLLQRSSQYSAIQGRVPEVGVYTDNFAPLDLAPGRRR